MPVDAECSKSSLPGRKTAGHAGEGRESAQVRSCHRVYPIKDDIPVMLIDDATIEKRCLRVTGAGGLRCKVQPNIEDSSSSIAADRRRGVHDTSDRRTQANVSQRTHHLSRRSAGRTGGAAPFRYRRGRHHRAPARRGARRLRHRPRAASSPRGFLSRDRFSRRAAQRVSDVGDACAATYRLRPARSRLALHDARGMDAIAGAASHSFLNVDCSSRLASNRPIARAIR